MFPSLPDQQILVEHALAQLPAARVTVGVRVGERPQTVLERPSRLTGGLRRSGTSRMLSTDSTRSISSSSRCQRGDAFPGTTGGEEVALRRVGDDHDLVGSVAALDGLVVAKRLVALEHEGLLGDVQLEVLRVPGEARRGDQGQRERDERMVEDDPLVGVAGCLGHGGPTPLGENASSARPPPRGPGDPSSAARRVAHDRMVERISLQPVRTTGTVRDAAARGVRPRST